MKPEAFKICLSLLSLSDDVGRLARPSGAYLAVAPALFRFCCRLDGIIGCRKAGSQEYQNINIKTSHFLFKEE